MRRNRTVIDDPDLKELLDGIHSGTVALPNFQRDFDWSDGDIKSLLATVLSGWPMGSLLLIAGNPDTQDFYDPRPFEYAPQLNGPTETIVLDGQQRLTALYASLYNVSDDVYYIRVKPELDWGQIDQLDNALASMKRTKWHRLYPNPSSQWHNGIIPISALRTATEFYAWRDRAAQGDVDVQRLTELYRDRLAGLHNYRVPALEIPGEMHPAAVARIFERVNKTGRRLGVFDLMVAKSFSSHFNLRTAWEEVRTSHPLLDNFYGDDGLAPLQVIALRTNNSLRSSAVLELTGTAVQDNWERAVQSIDLAIQFARSEFGVVNSDWLPYGNLMTVLAGLAWETDLHRICSIIRPWFWSAVFTGRYAVGSNTLAESEYLSLREDKWHPFNFAIDSESLRESTKKSSGALHRAWMCSMVASCFDGRTIGIDEVQPTSFFPKNETLGEGGENAAPHLLTLGFILTTDGEVTAGDQLVPRSDWTCENFTDPSVRESFMTERILALEDFLRDTTGVEVRVIAPSNINN